MLISTTQNKRQKFGKIVLSGIITALAAVCVNADVCAAASVSIYLNVEKGGSLVSGLTQENFRPSEDGQPKLFRLEPLEAVGAIALLVEHSRSSANYFGDLSAAMDGFLKHAPEGHWYALATFSHGLEVQTDFTKQIGTIMESYSRVGLPLWNEIDTYDAVYEMLDKMGKLPGRRVLIVIGSGLDSFSEKTLDQVKEKVDLENVVIFAAGAGSAFRGVYQSYLGSSARMSLLQAQAFLRLLADRSGGYAWFPNQQNAFPDVMRGIMQSVATQYRIVYDTNAPKSGKFHPIKVEAFRIMNDKRENFKVLVRDGWR